MANRPGTSRTASPAGPTSTSRRDRRRQARAGGRLLKAEGYDFDLAYTSVLKRAIRTLWHRARRDGPHVAAGAEGLAPERAPLRRAAGPEQGGDGGEVRRRSRCWSGGAATTRRRPRWKPSDRALASATTRATPARVDECRCTECLKDTVARVVPYWDDGDRAGRPRGQARAVAAHGNSLRALVKYLDGISDDEIVGLNIPTGIPLVYELDDDAEAAQALLPRRSRRDRAARRRGRGAGEGEGLKGAASPASRLRLRLQPGAQAGRRSARRCAGASMRSTASCRRRRGHASEARDALRDPSARSRTPTARWRAQAPRARQVRAEAGRIAERRRALAKFRSSRREAAIERMLVAWSAAGAPDALRVVLSGDDPARPRRNLHYLGTSRAPRQR